MENIPLFISILFGLTTMLTIWLFYTATNRSMPVLIISLIWLLVQGLIANAGFYTVTNTLPPRFVVLIVPPLAVVILLFITNRGKRFLDALDIKVMTWLHIARIPVEVVLFFLFTHKAIPGIMTFEGRNFDILSGLTAPLIYYFGFIKNKLNKGIIICWNFCCLILLLNIVIIAVLSAPFPFQRLAFEQPNIAVLYFPYIWLPCFIVPIVLLAHLATLRRLLKTEPIVSKKTQ